MYLCKLGKHLFRIFVQTSKNCKIINAMLLYSFFYVHFSDFLVMDVVILVFLLLRLFLVQLLYFEPIGGINVWVFGKSLQN